MITKNKHKHRKSAKAISLTVVSAIATSGTIFLSSDKVTAEETYNSYGEYCRNYDNLTSASAKVTVKKLTERATIEAADNSGQAHSEVKKQWDEVVNTDLCYEVEPHLKQFQQIGTFVEDDPGAGLEIESRDLGPLIGLDQLRGLSVRCNGEAQNLKAISSLASLEKLELINCVVTDITPLSSLTNLRELNLKGNSITDISPLTSLTNLERLDLSHQTDPEQKIAALATDPDSHGDMLPEGGLIPGTLEDISPLSSMTNLKYLDLLKNNISNISPLSSLIKLEELSVANNNISDISSLETLTTLTRLGLEYNSIPESARVCPVRESACKGLESTLQEDVAGNSEQKTAPTNSNSSSQQTNPDPATIQEQPEETSNESDNNIEETIEETSEKVLDSIF